MMKKVQTGFVGFLGMGEGYWAIVPDCSIEF